MRLLPLIFILSLVAACGKQSTTSSSSRQNQEDTCQLNGQAVECESIRGADGLGVDLLDTVIDVPVEISNSEITFLAPKSSFAEGRRISCKTQVQSGEVYRYSLEGNTLRLQTDGGSFNMKKLNDEKNGISGTWAWKGYVDQGTHVIKTISFIGTNRAILKTHCEL